MIVICTVRYTMGDSFLARSAGLVPKAPLYATYVSKADIRAYSYSYQSMPSVIIVTGYSTVTSSSSLAVGTAMIKTDEIPDAIRGVTINLQMYGTDGNSASGRIIFRQNRLELPSPNVGGLFTLYIAEFPL